MRTIPCEYHPLDVYVEATVKCYLCANQICLEHTINLPSYSGRNRVMNAYCPECANRQQLIAQEQLQKVFSMQNSMLGKMKWMILLPIIIFAVIAVIMVLQFNSL
ncbi:MAG: hypothetical protein INQ03_15370 [Candidatus Heimdallarchaeota archaeon]|nr:hypothetical protein [Candidatus Heimdallarchaeota archaeon]